MDEIRDALETARAQLVAAHESRRSAGDFAEHTYNAVVALMEAVEGLARVH